MAGESYQDSKGDHGVHTSYKSVYSGDERNAYVTASVAFMLAALLFLNVPMSSSFLVLVLSITAYNNKLNVEMLFYAVAIGSLSDLTMNYLAHHFAPKMSKVPNNWQTMTIYFNQVGVFPSAMFGGVLTAGMVLNTALVMSFLETVLGWEYNGYVAMLVGFVVGALWGVVVESGRAEAAKELMVFYKNTKGGYLENRIWDGLTIMLATGLLHFGGIRVDLDG